MLGVEFYKLYNAITSRDLMLCLCRDFLLSLMITVIYIQTKMIMMKMAIMMVMMMTSLLPGLDMKKVKCWYG